MKNIIVVLASLSLVFLASCSVNTSDKSEENATVKVGEENVNVKTDDAAVSIEDGNVKINTGGTSVDISEGEVKIKTEE